MKVEHEVKLDRTEMSNITWLCEFTLKDRKKSAQLRKLLGWDPVSTVIKNGRLRWFGHVKLKDNADWIKHRKMTEVDRMPKDNMVHMKSFGLS